jgi:transglutaminase-like putative cysteine protease
MPPARMLPPLTPDNAANPEDCGKARPAFLSWQCTMRQTNARKSSSAATGESLMHRHWQWALLALAALPRGAVGAEADPPGRLVEETWEAAHLDGAKVGFVHTTVREIEDGAGKRLRAAADMDLTFRRYKSLVRVRREEGTEETPEGRVLAVFMRQGQEGGPRLVLRGVVEEGRLHVRVDGGRIEQRIPWSADVVGCYGREHLFAKRRPEPGKSFSFLRYEPTFNAVVTTRVRVGAPEEVPLPGGSRKLLRVDMTVDKIEVPGASAQPPPSVWWLDADFRPLRREIELEGLGTVVLTRTTREAALAAAPAAKVADVGLKSLLPLNRAIPRPHETRAAVYRVTIRGDSDAGTALARDAHQDIRALEGNSFELHVHPPRAPEKRPGAGAAPAEYLAACPYIDGGDERVRALAARAVGEEKDPWKKARRIERWVKQAVRVDNAAPLVPASQTARELRGDCRHCALLTAALCRAEGIPSRTAFGLLYVEKGGRPYLGFHTWTEVWIEGQWLGLDATLGRGGVDAAHLKVSDHGWQDVQSLTPLLPVARVLGKIAVEVVRIEGSE